MQLFRSLRLTAVLAVGVVLVAAGCSKSNDSGPSGGGQSSQPAASASASAGGSAVSQLEAYGSEWAKTPAKIAYHYSGGSSGTQSLGDFTLFWQPPGAWRMDINSSGSRTTMIQNGQKSYVCSSGHCVAIPATQGGAPIPFLSAFSDPKGIEDSIAAHAAGVNVSTSSQTIAGQDASCYSVSGSAQGETGTGEWCFSSSGLLLLYQANATGASAGTFKLEATQVGSVSSSDFDPPFPVTGTP